MDPPNKVYTEHNTRAMLKILFKGVGGLISRGRD